MTGRKGVINVIEEVRCSMWRGDCHPQNPTAGMPRQFARGGVFKKRERRDSGKKCGGYARMCGIKDCPEVDLCFQGTGMNGWLVSAVYDTMKV